MKANIKLFAYFRDNRFIEQVQDLADGTTVGQVVDNHSIDREEVGVLMINSRHCTFESEIREGDIVAIFPVVGGG